MRKREIDRQFDAIIEFAGVHRFLDTPVKRYSSGMYVRLAFSVAAHLETEILLVDEVLSVGDAEFQKRCLGKMEEVASEGRTVLFVTHNMHAMSRICTRAVQLGGGRLVLAGTPGDVVAAYLAVTEGVGETPHLDETRREGTGEVRVVSARPSRQTYRPDEPKQFRIRLAKRADTAPRFWISVHVKDDRGLEIAHCDSRAVGLWPDPDDATGNDVVLTLDEPWLMPGRYWLDVFICASGIVDRCTEACSFEISPVLPYPEPVGEDAYGHGVVLADFSYSCEPTDLAGSLDPSREIERPATPSREY